MVGIILNKIRVQDVSNFVSLPDLFLKSLHQYPQYTALNFIYSLWQERVWLGLKGGAVY